MLEQLQKVIGELLQCSTCLRQTKELLKREINRTSGRPHFIEIGGPETHVKIYLETEQEAAMLQQIIHAIIYNRERKLQERYMAITGATEMPKAEPGAKEK
jgi:hypothetical protein